MKKNLKSRAEADSQTQGVNAPQDDFGERMAKGVNPEDVARYPDGTVDIVQTGINKLLRNGGVTTAPAGQTLVRISAEEYVGVLEENIKALRSGYEKELRKAEHSACLWRLLAFALAFVIGLIIFFHFIHYTDEGSAWGR